MCALDATGTQYPCWASRLFGARAFKSTMPAPSISHGGPNIMAEIMLFRGVNNGSTSG